MNIFELAQLVVITSLVALWLVILCGSILFLQWWCRLLRDRERRIRAQAKN